MTQKLLPLVEAINQYGAALDVLSNTSSLLLCPIWGGFRIILFVRFVEHHTPDKADMVHSLQRNAEHTSTKSYICFLESTNSSHASLHMSIFSRVMKESLELSPMLFWRYFAFAPKQRLC